MRMGYSLYSVLSPLDQESDCLARIISFDQPGYSLLADVYVQQVKYIIDRPIVPLFIHLSDLSIWRAVKPGSIKVLGYSIGGLKAVKLALE